MMNEVRITTAEDLIRSINDLPNNFFYRGHADASWPLQSSLERMLGNSWSSERAQRFEENSISLFQSKFHLYDKENIEPDSKLAWLSIMQHYGVPTRLLDFTESPYVALYFALEAYNPQSGADLAIFALDYSAIMDQSISYIASKDVDFKETRVSVYKKQDQIFETIVDRFAYSIAWITEPQKLNARLDRQSGSFLLSGDRSLRIANMLTSEQYKDVPMHKFIVPASLYTSVFALLRKMNITSKSLYGDLDGLARSIRMQMQAYAIPDCK